MNEASVAALIVREPIGITNRLADLGWKLDDLLEVVSAMVRARNSCTENHPASAPGWMSWAEGIRRLREVGLSNGLAREDVDNIPWTVDKKRGIRFAVANTDDGTGRENRIPQNRSKKGAATDRAVVRNQSSIFDYIPEEPMVPISKVISHPGITVSWYLCVYADGDDVQAELSCPIITEAGFFADFAERIFLIGGDPKDVIVKRKDDDDGGNEYEIIVTRKQ
jgi:hypothetical protein